MMHARKPLYGSEIHASPHSARRAVALVLSCSVGVAVAAALFTGSDVRSAVVPIESVVMVLGSLCIGYAVLLSWLRQADRPRVWRSLAVWAALWFLASLGSFMATAANVVGVPFRRLSTADLAELLHSTALGQWGVVALVCPIVLCGIALDSARGGSGWHPAIVGTIAAVGLVSGPVSGHMSLGDAGWVIVSVHVIAAALWMGTLVAAATILRDVDSWSRVLPRYSRLAFWCVVAVGVSGLGGTVVRWDTSDPSRN
nr:hypothetical protein [Rhodococcus sp. (in: high G+C Gram-positive bacteria)]